MAVLIENMRREGFELSVSPPAVLFMKDAAGEMVSVLRVDAVSIYTTCCSLIYHILVTSTCVCCVCAFP